MMTGPSFSSCWVSGTLLPVWAVRLWSQIGTTDEPRSWDCNGNQPSPSPTLRMMLPLLTIGTCLPALGRSDRMLAGTFSEVETSCLTVFGLLRAGSNLIEREGLLGLTFPTVVSSLVLFWFGWQAEVGKLARGAPIVGLSWNFPPAGHLTTNFGVETRLPILMVGLVLLGAVLELLSLRILLLRTPTKKHRLLLATRTGNPGPFSFVIASLGTRLQSRFIRGGCEVSIPLLKAGHLVGLAGVTEVVAGVCLYISQVLLVSAILFRCNSDQPTIVSRLWKKRTAKVGDGGSWMPSRTSQLLPLSEMPLRGTCHSLMLSLVTKSSELKGAGTSSLNSWLLIVLSGSLSGLLQLVGRSANLVSNSYPTAGPSLARK